MSNQGDYRQRLRVILFLRAAQWMESNCSALALPEPVRFSLKTNTLSLVMKERLNLISLQVSMFSTVSPFATVSTHMLAMSGLLAGFNLFHEVCRKCGAIGQLRGQLGASFSSPSSYVVQSRSLAPVLCFYPLSLHGEAWICSEGWQRAFLPPSWMQPWCTDCAGCTALPLLPHCVTWKAGNTPWLPALPW